jgi:hypothetical protein
MKFFQVVLLLNAHFDCAFSFSTFSLQNGRRVRSAFTLGATVEQDTAIKSTTSSYSNDIDVNQRISGLGFRELQRECEDRKLDTVGTTATLRARLRQAILGDSFSCDPDDEECVEPVRKRRMDAS